MPDNRGVYHISEMEDRVQELRYALRMAENALKESNKQHRATLEAFGEQTTPEFRERLYYVAGLSRQALNLARHAFDAIRL